MKNLTQVEETLPTLRDLYHLWLHRCSPPCTVHYYDSLEEVPVHELDRQQRLWLQFTGVNLQIASYPWSFETRTLEDLASRGLEIAQATLQTLAVCQEHFISASPRMQEFLRGSQVEGEPARLRESRGHRARTPPGDGAREVLADERAGVPG